MTDIALDSRPIAKAPWHVWAVGMLSVLWNGAGAYTIMTAQAGVLPDLEPGEAAYYAAQAWWFVIVTDLALVAAVLGGVALVLRSRIAVPLFWVSLAAIVIANGYDLMMGTSRMFLNAAALGVSVAIWIIAALELWYAHAMRKRGVLR